MTIRKAIGLLEEKLIDFAWFYEIGFLNNGKHDIIVVYVDFCPQGEDIDFFKSGWEGFEVIIKNLGPTKKENPDGTERYQ